MLSEENPERSGEVILQGIGVSPGVAVGEVVLFSREGTPVPDRFIDEEEMGLEIDRLDEALLKTRHQIAEIQNKVMAVLGKEHAGIFDAHLMVVDDRSFLNEIMEELRKQKKNMESIIRCVADRYIDALSTVDDDYLRDRAADVRDVTRRIIRNLAGDTVERMDQIERPCIAVAADFLPSDTAGMNRNLVHAFTTSSGSSTSHTAIMARALEVPAVVGVSDVTEQVRSGETVLVDGSKGIIIIRPTSKRLLEYAQKAEEHKAIICEFRALRDKPSETQDGHRIQIAANIELPSEVEQIEKYGAVGVGLFRTEFLFLNEDNFPDEDEQAAVYASVAEHCAPNSVVIRTLDLGGDKFSGVMKSAPEKNPFLGWRAIRFCLGNRELFKTQLRAILRAGAGRNISMMYPMVSCLREVTEANELLEECRKELAEEGVAYAKELSVGIMIEIPSAALVADRLAKQVDFFSIGTNDLIQYTLAVDRVNPKVAYLYQPTHPAILQLIRLVVHAANTQRIPVAVCGQMASDPALVPLLIGLGIREISISPSAIPMIKDIIRNIRLPECKELAKEALNDLTAEQILERCRDLLAKRSPEILEFMS